MVSATEGVGGRQLHTYLLGPEIGGEFVMDQLLSKASNGRLEVTVPSKLIANSGEPFGSDRLPSSREGEMGGVGAGPIIVLREV